MAVDSSNHPILLFRWPASTTPVCFAVKKLDPPPPIAQWSTHPDNRLHQFGAGFLLVLIWLRLCSAGQQDVPGAVTKDPSQPPCSSRALRERWRLLHQATSGRLLTTWMNVVIRRAAGGRMKREGKGAGDMQLSWGGGGGVERGRNGERGCYLRTPEL